MNIKNYLLTFAFALLSLSGVQAACVFVDFDEAPSSSGMNHYTSFLLNTTSGSTLALNDAQGALTSYTLKITKNVTTGRYWDSFVTKVTPSVGDPDYFAYYQNTEAMKDLTDTVGQFDYSSLASYFSPGAAGATTASIQLGGLTIGNSVTFYMFVSALQETPDAMTMTGGTGKFQYAATDGTDFADSHSFALTKLTLVKWTGVATGNTLDFKIGGKKSGVAAAAFKVVPEPSTASLGLLALSGLLLRRRRSC